MCVWYSLRNVKCYISDMFFDSSTSINHDAFRRKLFLDSFTVVHKYIFGLGNAVLITHDDAEGLAF